MKLTYTDLWQDFLDKTGNTSNSSDTALIAFFKRNLGQKYQFALAELANHQTQQPKTFSTVADQQFYHNPNNVMDIESVVLDIGSYDQPLIPVESQRTWDWLNAQQNANAYPEFIFKRRDDFGLYPIPTAVYTGTINSHIRDRNLQVEDYTTGTVTVTNNSQTVTGVGTTWTVAMIGRWFTMNDPLAQGEGYWYRISGVGSTTSLTLETSYEGVTTGTKTYRIGQVPELPDEIHIHLADGVAGEFFAGRGDIDKASWWNNRFLTGDGSNKEREDLSKITGGILGAKARYSGRSNGSIVTRKSGYYRRTNNNVGEITS